MWLIADRRDSAPPHTRRLRALDLDRHVFPSIQAGGLYAVGHSQYWLADTPPPEAVVVNPPPATTTEKPPYRVPLLAEIQQVPWSGIEVVSTFAGGGGTSTGHRIAGARILAAVEFVPAAADTYEANAAPYTKVLRRDVREITGREILRAIGKRRGQLDVLDGSPPCEPFSTAGTRDKHWGQEVAYSGQRQRTDDLLLEYARLVDEIRPRVFVAENVTGLVRGRAKGQFKRVMAALRDLGYDVQARVLDAQWLGVPQHRERVIIVGVRSNLRPRRAPRFPDPLPYNYTVRDALQHIARIGTDPNFDRRRRENMSVDQMMVPSDRPHPTVQCSPSGAISDGASGANGYVDEVVQITGRSGSAFERQPWDPDRPSPTIIAGGGQQRVEVDVVGYEHDTGGQRQAKPRDRLDEPSPTITNGGSTDRGPGAANPSHYKVVEQVVGNDAFEPRFGTLDQPSPTLLASGARTSGELKETDGVTTRRRTLTIPELKRISGFPDDYVLTGTFSEQWERLGDCVPPPMAAAIATTIRDEILDAR